MQIIHPNVEPKNHNFPLVVGALGARPSQSSEEPSKNTRERQGLLGTAHILRKVRVLLLRILEEFGGGSDRDSSHLRSRKE